MRTRKPRRMRCPSCQQMKDCYWGPDPYASEIHNNNTPVWECADCRYQSAQDI
jgi:C4-type Zn-finger protein